ncbi:MAG: hypothetical protein Q4C89_01430 [Deinococcus sp.]|uniref:hypothetical protein n=1 Tax=Deinococcus sp. TaxID=47478 RepID=UPI0026DDC439|nr:hypothetical protein [Deinococcus sp.]MDO4244670.1 hypothetical protein [Deinococcus sp.]
MTGRASLLRRVEAIEAAHAGRVEEAKRAQLRAALEALPPAVLRAFREEGRALQDPEAWAAFLEESRAYFAGRGPEVADLEGPARWGAAFKRTGPGQPWPTPKEAAHFAGVLEAHAVRLWGAQFGAGRPEARRFFRYSGACFHFRASLLRVLS